MKIAAKLMPAMLTATVIALAALGQHASAAVMPSEATDIQNAVNAGFMPSQWQERTLKGITSTMLEGRQVMGANGQSLGYILAVNDLAGQVQLQTNGDLAITLPDSALRVAGGKVYATGMGRVATK